MAGTAAFEEALRLVLETSGTEGVDDLRQALVDMGVAAEDVGADTAKLVDKLAALNATAGKAEAFESMMRTLGELEQRFDANQRAALELGLKIGETVTPSRDLLNAQKALRAEGDKLQASLSKQWQAVAKADAELRELGVDTSQLAAGQQRLRTEATRTAQAFTEQAKASAQAAAEARKRNDQIEQSDAGFRAQAKASTAAAEALKAYRERANQATRDTAELGTAAEAIHRRDSGKRCLGWSGHDQLRAIRSGRCPCVELQHQLPGWNSGHAVPWHSDGAGLSEGLGRQC